jgi:hypothetical protein
MKKKNKSYFTAFFITFNSGLDSLNAQQVDPILTEVWD